MKRAYGYKPEEKIITITYSSIDGASKTRKYWSLKGAQKFAQEWIGETPTLGRTYAISDDGVGKIEVEGVSLQDLFPGSAS